MFGKLRGFYIQVAVALILRDLGPLAPRRPPFLEGQGNKRFMGRWFSLDALEEFLIIFIVRLESTLVTALLIDLHRGKTRR